MNRQIIMIAVALFLLCFSAVPVCADMTSILGGDPFVAGLSSDDINRFYNRAFGRNAKTEEIQYWLRPDVQAKFPQSGKGRKAGETERVREDLMVKEMKKYLTKPEGAQELRDTIDRSYKASFNRAPTADDFAFWQSEVKAKNLGYEDLIKAHKSWEQSAKGEAYRVDMINKVYPEIYGRGPSDQEMNYWKNELKNKGYTYDQLRGYLQTWYTGSSEAQRKELSDTVTRAYARAGLASPTQEQMKTAMAYVSTKRPAFVELVKWVRSTHTSGSTPEPAKVKVPSFKR
jgi:hypothetical protein